MKTKFNILILLKPERGYDRDVLRGIARYSRVDGPWSFYTNPISKKIPELVKEWPADGIICIHTKTNSINVNAILKLNIPSILPFHENLNKKNVIQLQFDNHAFGKCAADHLISCGFKNLAFCPSVDRPWLQQRRKGFQEVVYKKGLEYYAYQVPKNKKKNSWANEQLFMVDWLKSLPKPVGIMADVDERSAQVIEACQIADLTVPTEVAIIGVENDDLICELSYQPLSSVALNAELSGFEAAKMLGQIMRGKKPGKNIIVIEPAYTVTRASTDTVAVNDEIVAKAVQFIKENPRKNLQVSDVADEVCVSKRLLYKRFNHATGYTPYDAIRRSRNEEIAKLLVETNMTITGIAEMLGFNNIAHIARTFKQKMGMSTTAYRKKHSKK